MLGVKVSRPFIASIMKKKDLRSVTVRPFKQTTNSNGIYGIVENKLSQSFTIKAHNRVWISDITYIKIKQG